MKYKPKITFKKENSVKKTVITSIIKEVSKNKNSLLVSSKSNKKSVLDSLDSKIKSSQAISEPDDQKETKELSDSCAADMITPTRYRIKK